jgi:hypothetical protein
MGRPDDVGALLDVLHGAHHSFKVVEQPGGYSSVDIGVDLAHDITDQSDDSLRRPDIDSLAPRRVRICIEHAIDAVEDLFVAFDQVHPIPQRSDQCRDIKTIVEELPRP